MFLSIQFHTNVSQLVPSGHVLPWSYTPLESLGELTSTCLNRLKKMDCHHKKEKKRTDVRPDERLDVHSIQPDDLTSVTTTKDWIDIDFFPLLVLQVNCSRHLVTVCNN